MEEKEVNDVKKVGFREKLATPEVRQLYASVTALTPLVTVGSLIGFSSILLPQLQQDNIIKLDPAITSWIAAIAVLPLAPFAFIAGYTMERFGRKRTHYLVCFFLTVGWIIIAAFRTLEALLIGRFLTGIGMGFQGPLTSVYIAETTSPETRHVFLACIGTLLAVGILFVHLLGTYFKWWVTAWACAVLPLLSGLMIIPLHDTPNYYLLRGNTHKSNRSFTFYRGISEKTNGELEKMVNAAEHRQNNDKDNLTKIKEVYSAMKKREFVKPFIIMLCFFLMSQFSGNNVIAFYSVQIIQNILEGEVNPFTVMLAIDAIRLISSIFASSVLLRYCSKRTSAIISSSIAFVSLNGMAIFIYLQKNSYISNDYYWVSLLFLSTYIISLSLGIIPLPWSLLGELFPANLKGIGGSLVTFFTCMSLFIVTKVAPSMFENWGISMTFVFYGIWILIPTIIIAVMLPETQGKTLQEIEEHFKKKKEKLPPI